MVSRWGIFQSAEMVLEQKLKENPTYPFEVIHITDRGQSVFVHSRRLPYIYFSIGGCMLSLLCMLIWWLIGTDKEYYLLLSGLVFVGSAYLSLVYNSVRTVVLDNSTHNYSIYHGHHLTIRQPYHNIYLRLIEKKAGINRSTLELMIDGYGFETPIRVSRLATNKQKLRAMAHLLAANLNINYFDISDVSKKHIVRHYPTKFYN